LREDEIPSGEEDREEPATDTGEDEARDASSNESRGAARPFLSCENPGFDISFLVVKPGGGRWKRERELDSREG
jgi:hypothetical protein